MKSQANKWGWKALATRMLLAPVLMAGPFAVPAFAQTGSKPVDAGKSRMTAPAPTKTVGTTDPKELLKQGRKALVEGRFDAAQDFARQADANNPQGRWGLLGDTPESLLKDCQSARAKADKVEAVRLVKEAKDLFGRPAKTETDRAANLDQAATKIDRACTLSGPTGFIDELNPFADRPESLKREIDSARGKLRRTVPAANDARATYAAGGTKPATGLPKPSFAGIVLPKALEVAPTFATAQPVSTGNRAAAVKLMEEGRSLVAQDFILEATVKFNDANKLNVPFAYNEENPDRCLQDASAKGKEKIESLVRIGQEFASRKEVAKAEASYSAARKLAVGLAMRTFSIDAELAALKTGKSVVMASAQLPDAPPLNIELVVPDSPKPVEKVEFPTLPDVASLPTIPGEPKIEAPKLDQPKLEVPKLDEPKIESSKPLTPKLPDLTKPLDVELPTAEVPKLPSAEQKPAVNAGRLLLDDAVIELKSGQVEMARKLAVKAHNGDFGVKAEAQQLLREIDAEMHTAKKKEAVASFKAASEAFNTKQYDSVEKLLELIDPTLLTPEQAKSHAAMLRMAGAAIAKAKEPLPGAAPTTPPSTLIPSTPTAGGAANLADQMKALTDVEFQQLRSEGLQAESQALEAFKKGETDVAITTLGDFVNKVKMSKLTTARQTLLAGPAERRLDTFRIMKKQMDFYTKEAKEKRDQRDGVVMKSAAEQQKQDEIAKRVQQVNGLLKSQKYREAEALALQTKSLDPENPTIALIYELAKNNRRVNDAKQLKSDKEQFNVDAFRDGEKQGPYVDHENPIAVALNRSRSNLNRGPGDELFIKTRTPIEREIESKLEKPLTLEFQQAPLREVIRKFADTAVMNIVTDDAALADLNIDLDKVLITESIKQPISLRNVMQVILEKSGLQFVVGNDVVSITSMKKAKGRMHTKVFSVMDLVTPIPDFALPEHASLSKALERQQHPTMPWMQDTKATSSISTPKGGLGVGQLASGNAPWQNTQGFGQPAGVLENQPGSDQNSPLSPGAFLAPTKANHSEQLKRLVTGMIRPYSWEDLGGSGRISYYDIGGALVVNQTADVIKEVQDLLESLRRLQDLSVAVEIRIISLTESFYERIGVDFQMNIKTHNSPQFESGLTTGAFRPEPFINNNVGKGTVGYNPAAGGFTSDLNVPIRPNTYGFSVPPFGGYPGNNNGGLNLGLAFLNDIQVFLFLEASAGDRRVNVMQAPKITLFNGQTSTVSISDLAYFTLGLQIINVGGQFVYIPQNTPLPIGQGAALGGGQGVSVTVQAVVSADRRYVRMNLAPQLSALASATVPLFPVTAFITPVFEGGSQGQPIPFTQFFQQPSFTSITVQTTVAVPDGGTVLLGGLKTLEEGRNEFGPPVISQIPYLNRLFRNTGIGRDTRHIMIMVTPRIIITSEEEQIQTSVGGGLTGGGN